MRPPLRKHLRLPLALTLSCALVVPSLEACAVQVCSTATCRGCCVDNVCYEGGCGRGGEVDAGERCISEDFSCATGKCCATGSLGDPLVCKNGGCFPDCKTDGACSSNRECCASPRSGAGSFCDLARNRCSFCWNKGKECIPRTSDCCPGLTCGSKQATPNFSECL